MNEIRREALVEAIRRSGMSISEFAQTHLAREYSTVYRWLRGVSPVPKVVANWLANHATDQIRRGS